MIPSAVEYADALQALNAAETPAEKTAAAIRFTAAEAKHLEKMGVQRQPQGFFFRVVVPSFILISVTVTLVLVSIFAVKVFILTTDLQEAQLTDCQQRNQSRIASIEEKESGIEDLEAELTFLKQPQSASYDSDLAALIAAKNRAIGKKEDAIQETVDSIAKTAKYALPRTTHVPPVLNHAALEVNCERTY